MPDRRPCACDKCGRRFDFVHHLHRHAVLQHGLGFRVDPDTDCVQAYRPADLLDMQKRFRGWQGHQHDHDSRSRSPGQSVDESAGRRGRAPSRGRGGRGSRSWRPSRSRSPRVAKVDQGRPNVHRSRRSSPVERNLGPALDSRVITSNRPSPARLVGQHKISTEIPAALGAPPPEGDTEETLDERIGRL